MMKWLFVLAFGLISCLNTNVLTAQDYQREKLAEAWISSHYDKDGLTISCSSKRWGRPLCDVKNTKGEVVFWLGCHVSPGPQFCVQEKKR